VPAGKIHSYLLRKGKKYNVQKGECKMQPVFLSVLFLSSSPLLNGRLFAELANPLYLPQSTNPSDLVLPPDSEPPPAESAPDSVTIYEWVDSAGVLHFTDRPERIPPAYRGQVRERRMRRSPPSRGEPENSPEPMKEKDGSSAVTTTEQWQRIYRDLIEEYRKTYEEYQKTRYRLARAVSEGKPPGELELIRAEKKAIGQKLLELKGRIVHFPEELQRYREPSYWVTPWEKLGFPEPDETP
jgi:hypothetical protein